MTDTALILVVGALGALAVVQVLQARRLAAVRDRMRRSLHVGPQWHLRLQRQVFERLVAMECRERGVAPRGALEFRSEWGEDILLYELFYPQAAGVYVEAGALDGRTNSVTWVFEALGWTGLLVEPIPERAEECRRNRPASVTVHAALGPAGAGGLTAFLVPDSRDHQLSAYREHEGMGTAHVRALERAGATLRRVEVPLASLNDLLAESAFDRVDFASIDVEGAELDVLRGFDLNRFRPRVLVVEDLTLGADSPAAALITSTGYEQVLWIGMNRVFVRSEERDLLARARRLAETVYSPFVGPREYQDTVPRGHV